MERVRRWLQLAGCKKVFPVSSITGEGIAELAQFLNEDTPTKRVKKAEESAPTPSAMPKREKLETYLL